MTSFCHNPLLAFLIHMTQSVLLRQIAYLKAENQILRSRLPKAVQTTPAERSLLVRLGSPRGSAIGEILGIVHYKTFLRWGREERDGANVRKPRHKPGRPGTTDDTTAIILRLARENGWGYSRIQGELKKLGIIVARNTVKNILIKNSFHPSPGRFKGDWNRFLKRHMETLWACELMPSQPAQTHLRVRLRRICSERAVGQIIVFPPPTDAGVGIKTGQDRVAEGVFQIGVSVENSPESPSSRRIKCPSPVSSMRTASWSSGFRTAATTSRY